MEEKLNKLKTIQAELSDLGQTAGLLGWDQQVNMPQGAAEARGNQMATLQGLIHKKSITPEIGQLIGELVDAAKDLDPAARQPGPRHDARDRDGAGELRLRRRGRHGGKDTRVASGVPRRVGDLRQLVPFRGQGQRLRVAPAAHLAPRGPGPLRPVAVRL